MSPEDIALKLLGLGLEAAPALGQAIAKMVRGEPAETPFEERVADVLHESLSRQAAERVDREQ